MKKIAALGMGLLLAGASVSTAMADSRKGVVDVQEVRAAIAAKRAGWRAKESWVTRLSHEEIQRLLGLTELPQGSLDFESAQPKAAPTAVDWRNKDGVNWLGPVMNQGNCGSCVAFAAVATLEGQVAISNGLPWLRPSFSTQQLFGCGGGGCDSGWQPTSAARYLQNYGVVDEACSPYTSGSTGDDVACSDKCSDASSRVTKISGYSMPSSFGGAVDAVKAALAKGPLVTTLMVYNDFLTYGGGVYKHVTGSFAGGHAVSLVGYDDSKRAWLIRNSWGPEWGEEGFGWVSWDDTSGVGASTWTFNVSTGRDQLSVTSPSDRGVISGEYALLAKRQGLEGKEVSFKVKDASGRMADIACTAVTGQDTCSANLDSTQLKEGRYEILAQSGNTRSQVREFFVLNSIPEIKLSLEAASGVDLSKPLSGRPEFVILTQSGAVPLQHLEFQVKDQSGKVVVTKSNDYVLERMKMGWRTISVPNGRYTISLRGELAYKGTVYSAESNTFSITVQN